MATNRWSLPSAVLNLCHVDMEEADWMGLEPLRRLLFALDLRQPADAMVLKAAMQGGSRQGRDRGPKCVETVIQRRQGVLPKGDDYGPLPQSSALSSRGYSAPVGTSATEVRFFHFATVF
jgi:hypothetical protein